MPDVFYGGTREDLARAAEANMQKAAALWGRLLGARFHSTPEAEWFISRTALSMFNGVIRSRLTTERTDEQIERILEPFRASGQPMTWLLGPSSLPDDLEQRLLRHGLELDERLPVMTMDLQRLAMDEHMPSSVTIKAVEDEGEMEHWLRVVSAGSGFPAHVLSVLLDLLRRHGYHTSATSQPYLAFLNDEPVGTSLLIPGGGMAGIYCVTTLEAARRQGIGRASTIAALLDARRQSYRFATLQSSQMGYKIYQSLGFQEVCTFAFYNLPATTWSPS